MGGTAYSSHSLDAYSVAILEQAIFTVRGCTSFFPPALSLVRTKILVGLGVGQNLGQSSLSRLATVFPFAAIPLENTNNKELHASMNKSAIAHSDGPQIIA